MSDYVLKFRGKPLADQVSAYLPMPGDVSRPTSYLWSAGRKIVIDAVI